MEKQNEYVLVDDLSKEISDLEERIKNVESTNKKKSVIKNVRIFGSILKFCLPLLVAIGIAFGASYALGDIPFYPQDVLKYNNYTIEFDNKGMDKLSSKYETKKALSSYVDYYSKWDLKADNRYYRYKKSYVFGSDEVSLDKLKEAISNNDNLDNILGKARSEKLEIKESLSEDDITNDGYAKVYYAYIDNNDFMMARQDTLENIGYSVCFVIFCSMTLFTTLGLMAFGDYCDVDSEVKNIKQKYKPLDISDLKKELEEKKLIYNKK